MGDILGTLAWACRQPATVVWLDWIGSLLMVGTFWGWLYSLVELPLQNRFAHFKSRAYTGLFLVGVLEWMAPDIRKGAEPKPWHKRLQSHAIVVLAKIAFLTLAYWGALAGYAMKSLLAVTEHVLVGRTGKALFALGFIAWNASKALSLYQLPPSG
jgi:hypothetical protein